MVLIAAANCFKTHIHLISRLVHDLTISSDHPITNSSPLVLGHIHEEHYVSLHPELGKCKWIKFCNFIQAYNFSSWNVLGIGNLKGEVHSKMAVFFSFCQQKRLHKGGLVTKISDSKVLSATL